MNSVTMYVNAGVFSVNEFRLSSWLNQQEDIQRMVLYQCDPGISKWTKHCIRQADAILIVAVADTGPSVGAVSTVPVVLSSGNGFAYSIVQYDAIYSVCDAEFDFCAQHILT